MEKMTLSDIQTVSLEILKEFDRFCKENDLQYSLAYGTLLGAVRHKGFIPWDDDIDVMMPKTDYDKFIKLYQDSEKYMCFAYEKNNCLLAYARLAEMNRTVVRTSAPWNDRESGVWIDVFPIVGVEDDKESYLHTAKLAYSLWRKIVRSRQAMGHLSTHRSFMWNLKRIAIKIIYWRCLPKYLKKLMVIINRFDYNSSRYVSNMSHLLYAKRSFFPKQMFDDYVELPFGVDKFRCIKDYDKFLTMIYNDYMVLPPVNKRRTHSYHNYDWK